MGPRGPTEAGDGRFLGKTSDERKSPPDQLDFRRKARRSADRRPIIGPTVSNSTNLDRVTFDESGTNESATLYIDNCGFPYYRSYRDNNRFQDAVLVKDVGISCRLIEEKPSVENYLIKRLKLEYNELSNITKKITTYTKDILNNLSVWDRRKKKYTQRGELQRPVAFQYFDDNGNPCLKLRLQDLPRLEIEDSIPSKFTFPRIFSSSHEGKARHTLSSLNGCGALDRKDNRRNMRTALRSQRKEEKMRQEKMCQMIFPNDARKIEMNSSTCSSSSVYNYLMTNKVKFCHKMESKSSRLNNTNSPKGLLNVCSNNADIKQNHTYSKRSNSVMVTNWQEISRGIQYKNRLSNMPGYSSNSRQKVNKHQKNMAEYSSALSPADKNSCVYDTKFQTVNIRILRRF